MANLELGLQKVIDAQGVVADTNWEFFVSGSRIIELQFNWTNAAGAWNGEISIEKSNDAVNWSPWVAGGLDFLTDDAGPESENLQLLNTSAQWIRIVYTVNGMTTIDIEMYASVKEA